MEEQALVPVMLRCQLKIERSEFSSFDGISLMNGGRDQGRDCVLTRGGKSYGLIQCKQYNKNIGKELVGKELTKFALYSILHKELIHDRDDFLYCLAVSCDLTNECTDFINDFNNKIVTETRLTTWVKENLRLPSLAPLRLKDPIDEVVDILKRIHVKKILPTDLDILLAEPPLRNLVGLFFKVQKVVDSALAEELKYDVKQLLNPALSAEDIETQLRRGSVGLRFHKNSIDAIPESHIEREETQKLYTWIINPLAKDEHGNDKNICLLSGDAGMGKSVILRDLYEKLDSCSFPVFALKADKLYPINLHDLQLKVGFSMPVFDIISASKKIFGRLIILIDQIDALSQSMSSDRNYLVVLRSLIDYYTYDPDVRIIISVRTFDLNYDPSLRIYKEIEAIKVGPLSEDQVLAQLQKIGITKLEISNKLLQLLRSPNNLSVFSIIYAKKKSSALSFLSVKDLYEELWHQKINSCGSSAIKASELKRLLYLIANKMFKEQRISLSVHLFETSLNELGYLISERIVIVEEKQLQFFHQSFYDYVFAKDFVESELSLVDYILEQNQTILIRSAVKMIVSYLREYDENRYFKTLIQLFKDQKILFHIKHLLVSILATLENPTEREKIIFYRHIKDSIEYKNIFFEQSQSRAWANYVIEIGTLDILIISSKSQENKKQSFLRRCIFRGKQDDVLKYEYHKHVASQYLRKVLDYGDTPVFSFISKIQDEHLIRWILFVLRRWDNEVPFELFKKCDKFFLKDSFGYFHTLENIIPYNPEFVFEEVKEFLLDDKYFQSSKRSDHSGEKKVLKKLVDLIPERFVEPLINNIERQIYDPKFEGLDFNGDFKYKSLSFGDLEHSSNSEVLYRLMANCLANLARTNIPKYNDFLEKYRLNDNSSILRLIIFSLRANINAYVKEVPLIFLHLIKCDLISSSGRLNYEFRLLFQEAFPLLNKVQRAQIFRNIRNLKVFEEIENNKRYRSKKHPVTRWGLTQYFLIRRLPSEFLNEERWLKLLSMELERKFKGIEDTSPRDFVMAGVVGKPLPQRAYEQMSERDWKRSFAKYIDDHNFDGGGLHEHSWAFKDYLKNHPTGRNIEILMGIISDPKINCTYKVRGIYGLTEAKCNPDTIFQLTKHLISTNTLHGELSLFFSIIEYLFLNNVYDEDLVELVINEALEGDEPKHWDERSNEKTSINGLVTAAINSSRGKASEYLVYINDKRYEEKVFRTVEHLLKSGKPEIRAVIYFRFAFLMNLDGQRAFELFVKSLNNETDEDVLASSLWSLQYLVNYDYKRLYRIFKKLIACTKLGNEDSNNLASILYICYLKNYPNAPELLHSFTSNNAEYWSWLLHEAFTYFYLFEDSPRQALNFLNVLLKEAERNDSEKFRFDLYKLEDVKFDDIKIFLNVYVNSKVFAHSEEFFKYLTSCCGQSPFECIDLFNKSLSRTTNIKKEDYIRGNDHATQFIIAGFNVLKGNDKKSKRYRQLLLKSFDKVLQDYRFRHKVEDVLEEVMN